MYAESDWIRAITNLIRKTSLDEIVWDNARVTNNDLPSIDDKPNRAYQASFKNNEYKVYSFQQRNFDIDTESFYWNTRPGLNIYNQFDEMIAQSPQLPVIYDLLQTVERKIAYDKHALKDLLG